MKLCVFRVLAITATTTVASVFGSALAQNAYIANLASGTVSVINTATNPPMVTATIPVPVTPGPYGVAVAPDGSRVYVTGAGCCMSVIDAASNAVIATIPAGSAPTGVAVAPNGSTVYNWCCSA